MNLNKYYAILTDVGLSKLNAAQRTNNKVQLTHMLFGDGNGTPYSPTGHETSLKREVWRTTISEFGDQSANLVSIEAIIPAEVGGWTIREAGVIDSEGDLIAIANYQDTPKPILNSNGTTLDLTIKLLIEVNNSNNVTVTIDPNVANASRKFVEQTIEPITQQLAQINNNTENLLSTKRYPRFIGHRGLMNLVPENTLVGFEFAAKMGIWGVECDILPTSDGHWVLMHDETVDRTTNGTGTVAGMTLTQIQALNIDAGSNLSLYPNLKVPTLEEYLFTCKAYDITPIIEIKIPTTETNYDKLISAIRRHDFENSAVITSSSYSALSAIRTRSKRMMLRYIVADVEWVYINSAKALGNIGFDVPYTMLNTNKVQLAHNNGINVCAYSIDSLSVLEDMIRIGVDFISTNVLGGVK